MKKIMVVFAVLVMMFFAGNAFAGCGNGCGAGMTGLEIAGGSAIGVQGYVGTTYTYSSHDSCFNQSKAIDHTGYVGASLMSSASGSACLTTKGNTKGGVSGQGIFESGIGSSIPGINFYTNSSVHISGGTR